MGGQIGTIQDETFDYLLNSCDVRHSQRRWIRILRDGLRKQGSLTQKQFDILNDIAGNVTGVGLNADDFMRGKE